MKQIKIPLSEDTVQKLQRGDLDTILISKQEDLQLPCKIILVAVNDDKKTMTPVGECIANSKTDLNVPGGLHAITADQLVRACVDPYSHYKIFRGKNYWLSELKVSDVKIW